MITKTIIFTTHISGLFSFAYLTCMVGPLIRHWHGAISSGLGQLLLLREKALARSEERIITHKALKRARNKYRPIRQSIFGLSWENILI